MPQVHLPATDPAPGGAQVHLTDTYPAPGSTQVHLPDTDPAPGGAHVHLPDTDLLPVQWCLKSNYLTLILLLVVPRSSPRETMRISPLLVLAMLVLSTPETMSRLLFRLY
jgi:hypothetical protein